MSKAEQFESEWKRYCESKGGGAVTMNVKDVARHFYEQAEKDLIKEALDATIDIVSIPSGWFADVSFDLEQLKEYVRNRFEQDDDVKVIIIKE